MNPLLICVGGVVVALALLGGMRRLRYESRLGLRLESLMRSPAAWERGHQAAAAPQVLAGVALVVAGATDGSAGDLAWYAVAVAATLLAFWLAHRAATRFPPR